MLRLLTIVVIFSVAKAKLSCNVNSKIRDEIQSYQPIVDQINAAVLDKGPRSGVLYKDLADFVDTFGARLSGSDALEDAIDDVLLRQQAANLTTSVHNVLIPRWERGDESARVVQPRPQKLNIIGLGNSASTPPEGLTAEVIVITSFDDLQAKKSQIPGKIVLFNVPFVSYGQTVPYRNKGPNEASKLGASAAIVRSVTQFSLDTPHTGNTEFDSPELRIPAAAITVEGANFIARLADKGVKVVLNISLQNSLKEDRPSRNAIGDIRGTSKPDEYVVISGHIDSWDPAQGAIDDACGAFLAWHSLALINELNLPRPARTLRAIMWTAEELGLFGARAYRQEREAEVRNWTIAIESDGGIWPALGIGFSGSDDATCIIQEIASLFSAANGTQVNKQNGAGSDIGYFEDLGTPLAEPYMIPNDYFVYHHSTADWVEVIKPEDLDQNLAIMASTIYILADMSITLPKTPVPPKDSSAPISAPSSHSSAAAKEISVAILFAVVIAFIKTQ